MPELPEVEVTRRTLEEMLVAQPRLKQFQFFRRDLRGKIPVRRLKALEGQKLLRVDRRAKYLLFQFERGGFLSSLGMTGHWRRMAEEEPMKHDHVLVHFADGLSLVYSDPRRFGFIKDFETAKPHLEQLGPEPLGPQFTAAYLREQLRHSSRPIKTALMDNALVTGIGNIYAAEALFLAGIAPARKAKTLTLQQFGLLVDACQEVLNKAIAQGGSSIRDFKLTDGSPGAYQQSHRVYARAGLPCCQCAGKIKKAKLAGRSSFWCSSCQS